MTEAAGRGPVWPVLARLVLAKAHATSTLVAAYARGLISRYPGTCELLKTVKFSSNALACRVSYNRSGHLSRVSHAT